MTATGGTLFDGVLIFANGEWRPMTPEAFFDLPLSARIRHVIERTVVFRLNGVPVDQKQALAEIRRLRASR